MNALVPIQDIEQMATAVAKSGLFGIKTPEQGVALMLIAQAEGLHPAIAARDYHIIQGRPALKADAMLARFQQAGGKVNWTQYNDFLVAGEFSHPQGGTVTISWDMEMAKKAGLAGKDNWRNFPRSMLRARCISEGIRTVFPGCVVGVYTPEEVVDFSSAKPPKMKNMGVAEEVVQEVPAAPPSEPEGAFALFVPGGEDAYSRYATLEDWQNGYLDLVRKISGSKKLEAAQKQSKFQDLWQANWEVLEQMPALTQVAFKSAIVENGGTAVVPKPTNVQDVTVEVF